MNFKKIVGAASALAMASSMFAGFAVTADAAPNDVQVVTFEASESVDANSEMNVLDSNTEEYQFPTVTVTEL